MMGGRWHGLAAAMVAVLAAGVGTVRLAYENAERYDNGRLIGDRTAAERLDEGRSGDTRFAGHDRRGGWNVFRERLTGFAEDPLAVSTAGNGHFSATVERSAEEITYQLSYADLAGDVTQAHIHFGGPAQSGGISVFLCTNLGNGPAGTQTCPAAPATVTGTIRPVDVVGPVAQGISAGEFAELVTAIRAGTTYVNVHSSRHPGGEIRAQLGHHRH
ncbi:CHRD domain-containing protein [Plantactinospora sonchi]|uniref:CHRD domain-containing protein n=1 Tax=Plantactinospora sonchi TaxID=1544735 RepID=A0ABU7RT45_9ACTN